MDKKTVRELMTKAFKEGMKTHMCEDYPMRLYIECELRKATHNGKSILGKKNRKRI